MEKVKDERDLSYDEWMDQFTFSQRTIYARSVTETEFKQVVDSIAMITPLPGQTAVPRGWAVIHNVTWIHSPQGQDNENFNLMIASNELPT